MKTIKQHVQLSIIFSLFFCYTTAVQANEGESAMPLTLKSPSFSHQSEIPKSFTCDGADLSPAINWSEIPENTKSLVLIVDDPDAPDPAAPRMTWVHWLLYNIPPSVSELTENIGTDGVPSGTLRGKNDWKQTGYRGPCPPIGRHRYFFKLYALDTVLPDLDKPNKSQLEKAMAGHIIGQAELIGTYQRK